MANERKKYPGPISIIDSDGRVIEGQLAILPLRGRKLHDWMYMFEQGLLHVAKANLRGESLKLLIYGLSQLTFDNEILFDAPHVFMYTNITPKNLRRPICELVEKRVLFPSRKLGSNQLYKPNPLLCWKGNSKNYPAATDLVNFDFHNVSI